jgi:tetratricopeptide (TPR) repeat protein
MQPEFKAIADLFAIAKPDDLEIVETKRKREGATAEESEALGRQSLGDGDFEAAIRHFKKAIAQAGPEDVVARIDLAGAYEYGDQYPQALRQYEKALRIKEEAEPHVGMSDLYRRYGRFRDSIAQLENAIELEPYNPYWLIKLAETLREAGEPKRALRTAQQAIVAKPDEPFYHYWIGDLLMELGRWEDALESLRAAIELSPGDDFLYLRASVGFWRVGRRIEAVKAIRLASDLDSQKNLYHGLLEVLLNESGLVEEAGQESERAAKMDRYDRDCLSRIASEMGIGRS